MHCDAAARKALSSPPGVNDTNNPSTTTTDSNDIPPVKPDLGQSNIPVKPELDHLDLGIGVIGGFSIALPLPFLSPPQRDQNTSSASAFTVGTHDGSSLQDSSIAANTPCDNVSSTTTAITTTIPPTTAVVSGPSPCPSPLPSIVPSMSRMALHYTRSIRLLQLLGSCTTPRVILFHLLAAVKWLVRHVSCVMCHTVLSVYHLFICFLCSC